MKKRLLFFASLLCLLLASCSDSSDEISVRRIKNLCEDEIEENCQDKYYYTLETGYYELDSKDARDQLVKLQANGLIDYKVERYAWYNKSTSTRSVLSYYKPVYFYGYFLYNEPVYVTKTMVDYDLEEHFMVTVNLTEKGKELEVDSLPTPKEKEGDLKKVTIDISDYDEYNANLEENWPEIPYPGKQQAQSKPSKKVQNKSKANKKNIQEPRRRANGDGPVDLETARKYAAALNKVHTKDAYLYAFELKASDAYNIRVINGIDGAKAYANVVFEIDDVSPVGRVMSGVYDNLTMACSATFIYYQDKGWQLSEDFELNPTERCEIEFKDGKKDKKLGGSTDSNSDGEDSTIAADDTLAADTTAW